jgi:hypothetical protein
MVDYHMHQWWMDLWVVVMAEEGGLFVMVLLFAFGY